MAIIYYLSVQQISASTN